MKKLAELNSSNTEYLDEVKALADEAKNFLLSHKWCKSIVNGYFDRGWGRILCVFYFEIVPSEPNVDNAVWIIVGDIPSAYIDIIGAKDGREALKCYVLIMEEWVANVKNGMSVKDCYPVNAPATIKYADMLETRLNLIKTDFIR